MAIEKKEPNEEIGKVRIAETLRAFQAAMQQPKEEPKANDPGTPMNFTVPVTGVGVKEAKQVEAMPLGPPTELGKTAEQVEDRDADVLRFAETLKQRRRNQPHSYDIAGSLDAMAQRLLNVVYSIDPAWEQRDSEVANEWGLSPAQRVIRYCMLIFDQQLHQNVVHGYDFAEIGVIPAGNNEMNLAARMEAECPQCHKTFTRKVPGQICCSNECGDAYFPKPERKEPVFDDNFEHFIESQNNPNRVPPVDPIRGPGMPVSGLVR